jgi:hypothetical protein
MPPPRADIVAGTRFGALTVIIEMDPVLRPEGKGLIRVFAMRCDCGQSRAVSLQNLRSGNTRSCGCKAHRKNPS